MSYKRTWRTIRTAILFVVLVASPASAQTQNAPSTSPDYQVNEYMFGTGGDPDLNSDDYSANASIGALGVGSSASEHYDAEAGFLTPSEPFLEMVVTEDTVDFGELSDSATSFGSAQGGGCSCSFNVRSYLSSEYVVVTVTDPPTNESGDTLPAKGTLGVPSASISVAEFGMNVVDNATPNMGSNPVNVPDDTFADGHAATGYNTPDQFKYGVGDIIARSPATIGRQAVGQTNYTISYIAKKNATTPAGLYRMDHVLVVVATY
jgi:hypothetical protein